MNRQGQRTDLTSVPVAQKSTSRELLGKEVGESQDQVRRYIRLTELIPELLDLVDEGRIAFRPAVELSYLQMRNRAPCWSKSPTQMPRRPLPRPLS